MRPAAHACPSVEALEDPARFELVRRLDHAALAPFVDDVLRGPARRLRQLHRAITVALAAVAVTAGVREGAGPGRWALSLAAGGAGTLLVLMPLHEALHAATYVALGARDIRWRLSVRPLAAFVLAHRFVVSRAAFRMVVLAPTLALDLGLAATAWAWPAGRLPLLCALVGHHTGSVGDLALLGFSSVRPGAPLYTYDDADRGSTAFFSTRPSTPRPTA